MMNDLAPYSDLVLHNAQAMVKTLLTFMIAEESSFAMTVGASSEVQ